MQNFPNNIILTLSENLLQNNYSDSHICCQSSWVQSTIFAVTAMSCEDITAFMELIQKQRFDKAEKEMKRKQRKAGQAKKRIAELDRIFKRIYEDGINGTISHERFLKLSAEYEA